MPIVKQHRRKISNWKRITVDGKPTYTFKKIGTQSTHLELFPFTRGQWVFDVFHMTNHGRVITHEETHSNEKTAYAAAKKYMRGN